MDDSWIDWFIREKTDRDISELKYSGEDYGLVLNIGEEEIWNEELWSSSKNKGFYW